jgi:RNA polymerase sigma factor (sigma-70 family)
VQTEHSDSECEGHEGIFATTHWSVVLTAGQGDSLEARQALETLCRTYWYPLYAYVRHRGHSPEDSQDLTQEFFLRLLQHNFLAQVDPHKGKFRSFLLAAMNHFLANEWERARTQKRGGQVTFVPLHELWPEERYQQEQSIGRSPEELYERTWALAFLQEVLRHLRDETLQSGDAAHFEELKVFLTGEKPPSTSYALLAARLGTKEATLRKEVQRLRHRYGELLHQEMCRTLSSTAEVEDELCHLFTVLGA